MYSGGELYHGENSLAAVHYGNGSGAEQSRVFPMVACKEEFNTSQAEKLGLFYPSQTTSAALVISKWRVGLFLPMTVNCASCCSSVKGDVVCFYFFLLSRPGGAHLAVEYAIVASADREMADVLRVSWSIWPSTTAMIMSMPT